MPSTRSARSPGMSLSAAWQEVGFRASLPSLAAVSLLARACVCPTRPVGTAPRAASPPSLRNAQPRLPQPVAADECSLGRAARLRAGEAGQRFQGVRGSCACPASAGEIEWLRGLDSWLLRPCPRRRAASVRARRFSIDLCAASEAGLPRLACRAVLREMLLGRRHARRAPLHTPRLGQRPMRSTTSSIAAVCAATALDCSRSRSRAARSRWTHDSTLL